MKRILRKSIAPHGIIIAAACMAVLLFGTLLVSRAGAASPEFSEGERLITVYDNGHERGLLTHATTLRAAFKEADIEIDPNDRVEPGLDDELVANNYEVNVYRAHPVTIVDGALRKRVMSPYRTAEQIAKNAGVELHDEDITSISANTDIVQGAGVQLEIDRATPFTFVMYGKKLEAYTQAETVGEMLKQKGITLASNDSLSVPQTAMITAGMKVELWRDGKQTITRDENVAFKVRQIEDADRPVGYKKIVTPGVKGKKTVVYEVVMKSGKEVSRKEIRSVMTKKPVKQVEVVGTKLELPPGSHQDWMAAAGISSSDYGNVNLIMTGESHWNPAAANPAGYYGLGQTNLAAISSACPHWQTDPICQLHFFTGYAGRYGGWAGAADYWASHRSW